MAVSPLAMTDCYMMIDWNTSLFTRMSRKSSPSLDHQFAYTIWLSQSSAQYILGSNNGWKIQAEVLSKTSISPSSSISWHWSDRVWLLFGGQGEGKQYPRLLCFLAVGSLSTLHGSDHHTVPQCGQRWWTLLTWVVYGLSWPVPTRPEVEKNNNHDNSPLFWLIFGSSFR